MNEFDYIPIAALNHYAYCPHRCWRMFLAGEFIDNVYTLEGTGLHERVHTVQENERGEIWQIRAIWLKSERYRLIGKSDLIESQNGDFFPVEYKRGDKGDYDNDQLQVCAQALCLEEMTGKRVDTGYIYYAATHQRQPVAIDRALRERAIAILEAIQILFRTGDMPPAIYSPRCTGCSLHDSCLPRLPEKVRRYREEV